VLSDSREKAQSDGLLVSLRSQVLNSSFQHKTIRLKPHENHKRLNLTSAPEASSRRSRGAFLRPRSVNGITRQENQQLYRALVNESGETGTYVLSSSLVVVHDTSRGGKDDKTERTGREQQVNLYKIDRER
jgi:hypothetical protein